MKKNFKAIISTFVALLGLFFAPAVFSKGAIASASTYDINIISTFAENENFSELYTDNSLLEESFNVLEFEGINLEVYDQNPYGTCYATSLAQTLNLCYEYRTGEHIKLSALALALQIKDLFFDEGSNQYEVIETSFDLDYVSEYDFPYELANNYYAELSSDTSVIDYDFDSKEIIDVSEYYVFPYGAASCSNQSTKDTYVEVIKRALVRDGALGIGMSYQVGDVGNYYIYDTSISTRGYHAMTLVGYDDNFSKENFISSHTSDGAFIILNSWGTENSVYPAEEIIYMSYEDFEKFTYIFGVSEFIDTDERDEEISNVDKAIYGMVSTYDEEQVTEDIEIGYQISNTSGNEYLSQIDLQPMFDQSYTSFYYNTNNIKVYLNSTNSNLSNGIFTLLGEYNISIGCNKIVLDTPAKVGEEFAIKLVIEDGIFVYGYADRIMQNFEAQFLSGSSWQPEIYSNVNYNLIKTPFYIRTVLSEETDFEISFKEGKDNYQLSNALEEIVYKVSSSASISGVGVQIFGHDSVDIEFNQASITNADKSSLFNISVNSNIVSITPKSEIVGTFKVIIKVNGGEKTFVKFITFDDKISLSTALIDPISSSGSSKYTLRLYQDSLMANEVNISIPSYFGLRYLNANQTGLNISNSFLFDDSVATASGEYLLDASGRITKAVVTFKNQTLGTTRVVTLNFSYQDMNIIYYVVNLETATHSNPKYVAKSETTTMTDAFAPNHNFLGWFTDSSYSEQINEFTPLYDGCIIYFYAKWQAVTHDIVSNVSYSKDTNLLTLELDYSGYNLSIYDTISFSSIVYNLDEQHSGTSFVTKIADSYKLQIYVEEDELSPSNSISLISKIQRFAFSSYNIQYIRQNVSAIYSLSNLVVSISSEGNGVIKNSSTSAIVSGNMSVPYNSDLYLNFVPDANYYVSDVIVNGVSIGQQTFYNFENITENKTIKVVFLPYSYHVQTTVIGNGSIGRNLIEYVQTGDSLTYTFTPSEGYYIESIFVDGTQIEIVSKYTFENITSNHTMQVTFKIFTFTISTTIAGNGSINHDANNVVDYGSDIEYIFEPSEGYYIAELLIDGVSAETSETYTFENVKENHTIYVRFEIMKYNISFTIVGTGSIKIFDKYTSRQIYLISTSTDIEVVYGTSLKYEFDVSDGCYVETLRIDGVNQTSKDEYSHDSICEDHSIYVLFKITTYTLKVNITGKGTVNYPTSLTKNYGEYIGYVFTPKEGYEISSVIVNGEYIGAPNNYTIRSITTNYVIDIIFVIQKFTITWRNFDESLIARQTVEYGTFPTPNFDEPTRASEVGFYFEFVGWNTKLDGSGSWQETATKNCTYYALFEKKTNQFEIKITYGENGTMNPSETIKVDFGSTKTINIIPDQNYHISKLFVDGKVVDSVENYTFENICSNHTISAQFKYNDFKTTISNDDEKGLIIGGSWFESGETATFRIEAKEGYKVKKVIVNEESVYFANGVFIVESVSEDLEISVEYEKDTGESTTVKNMKNNMVYAIIAIVAIVIVVSVMAIVKSAKNKEHV